MATELSFFAAFEGPAVADGRMNARDLGPSLFAMSALIEASSEPYFGVPGAVTLQVRADFRRGSFEYGLTVTAGVFGQHLLQTLSLSDLKTLLEGIGLLGRNAKSLLRILLQVGDKPIEKIEQIGGSTVNIHVTGDNNTIIVPNVDQRVAKLVSTPTVRDVIPDVVAPLARPGIDSYRVGTKSRANLKVTKDDLPKLQAPATLKTQLTDSVAMTALELLSPNFVDGNKWRVSQGGDPFWVRMLDPDFLQAVDRGEKQFMKGDYLIVDLRTRAYSSRDGLLVERDIERVIEHQHRARQLTLG